MEHSSSSATRMLVVSSILALAPGCDPPAPTFDASVPPDAPVSSDDGGSSDGSWNDAGPSTLDAPLTSDSGGMADASLADDDARSLDAFTAVDAARSPDAPMRDVCPVVVAPRDGCVLRCTPSLTTPGGVGRSVEGLAIHPTQERLLLAFDGPADGYQWLDLHTGALEMLGTDGRDATFASVAVSDDGTRYLRSRDSEVELVDVATGAATVVLTRAGTAPDVDFLPDGASFAAAGRLYTLPAPAGGHVPSSGRIIADAVDQSIAPSGLFGSFQRFEPPGFATIRLADATATRFPAPSTGSDSSAEMISDTRLVVTGATGGRAYIDRIDLPATRVRLLADAGFGSQAIAARGTLVVMQSLRGLAVYSCDL